MHSKNIILIKIEENCWAVSGSENISDARYLNNVDMEYTPYSGQYLTDFADLGRAKKKLYVTKGMHYCYGYPSFKGLQYAMNNGMPTRDDWKSIGCGNYNFPNGVLGDVRLKHVLNDVKTFHGVNKALDYLRIQPILGSLAIFNPEFRYIEGVSNAIYVTFYDFLVSINIV